MQSSVFKSHYLPIEDIRRALRKLEHRYRDVLLDVLLDDPHDGTFDVFTYTAPLLNGRSSKQLRYIRNGWAKAVTEKAGGEFGSSLRLKRGISWPPSNEASQNRNEMIPSNVVSVDATDCCSVLSHLRVQSVTRSGSDFEQLKGLGSDLDLMYELGPLAVSIGGTTVGPSDGATVDCTYSRNTGFVILSLPRQSACKHADPRLFSAATVRQVNHKMTVMCLPTITASTPPSQSKNVVVSDTGPACNVSDGDLVDIDHVPSLCLPFWPSEEFRQRRRAAGWPSMSLVADIVSYGVHLVPTGLKRSAMRRHEWRISFTRAETLLCWVLPDTVRLAVRGIKGIKKQIPEAQKKNLKSYLLKTIAFWMVECGQLTETTSVRTCMRQLLEGLLAALKSRVLSCFCYREINILSQFSAAELTSIQDGVSTLMLNTRQLMLSGCHQSAMLWLLQHTAERVTSHQLQVHVTRQWLRLALEVPFAVQQDDRLIDARLILRRRVANLAQASRRSHSDAVSARCILRAVLSCPRDVAERMVFTHQPDGSFVWDVSAIFTLLEESDINDVLFSDTGQHDLSAYLVEQGTLPPGQRHRNLTPDQCELFEDLSPRQRSSLLLDRELFFSIRCIVSELFLMRNIVLLDNMQIIDEALVEGGVGDAWRTMKWLPVMAPPPLHYPPPSTALMD